MTHPLTRSRFAMKAAAIAAVAAEWSRDSLHPYRPVDDLMEEEAARRFCGLIRERLHWIEEEIVAPADETAA